MAVAPMAWFINYISYLHCIERLWSNEWHKGLHYLYHLLLTAVDDFVAGMYNSHFLK